MQYDAAAVLRDVQHPPERDARVAAAVRREAEALSAVECLSDIQRRAGQHGSGRREGYDHKTYLSSERNQNDEGTNLYHTRLRGRCV